MATRDELLLMTKDSGRTKLSFDAAKTDMDSDVGRRSFLFGSIVSWVAVSLLPKLEMPVTSVVVVDGWFLRDEDLKPNDH